MQLGTKEGDQKRPEKESVAAAADHCWLKLFSSEIKHRLEDGKKAKKSDSPGGALVVMMSRRISVTGFVPKKDVGERAGKEGSRAPRKKHPASRST